MIDLISDIKRINLGFNNNGALQNSPLYNRVTTIYKGIDNTLIFRIKDYDRQNVYLKDKKIFFKLLDEIHQYSIEKEVYISDIDNNIYEVKLNINDLKNFNTGALKGIVYTISENNEINVLMTGTGNNIFIEIVLERNVTELHKESTYIDLNKFRYIEGIIEDVNTQHEYTSFISDNYIIEENYKYHSIYLSLNNFKGKFIIYKTLNKNLTDDVKQWVKESDETFGKMPDDYVGEFNINIANGETLKKCYQLNTKTYAFKFVYMIPQSNIGKIEKIILKSCY